MKKKLWDGALKLGLAVLAGFVVVDMLIEKFADKKDEEEEDKV